MKVFLRTWRYVQVTELEYHGSAVSYDAHNAVLYISKPLLPRAGHEGDMTAVTVTPGDEWTSELCRDECVHHREFEGPKPRTIIL